MIQPEQLVVGVQIPDDGDQKAYAIDRYQQRIRIVRHRWYGVREWHSGVGGVGHGGYETLADEPFYPEYRAKVVSP